jgi:hypothetical protein
MEALAFPFAAATVFTVGGYGIVQAKRHADAIGATLALVLVICLLLTLSLLLSQHATGACASQSDMCFAPWEMQSQAMMAL